VPDPEPIVAIAVRVLLQVPEPVPSVNVSVPDTATELPLLIMPGTGFTVTTIVTAQPTALVKVIVAVPADSAVTTPELDVPSNPTLVLLLVQIPPDVSLKLAVVPTHAFGVPRMGIGATFTVTVLFTEQPVPSA
jgi:hypothetical protein